MTGDNRVKVKATSRSRVSSASPKHEYENQAKADVRVIYPKGAEAEARQILLDAFCDAWRALTE